ncbi:hypothetical protein PFISCL1PPCAC_4372, partial [Pristionchus fissidentatus]
WIALIGSSASMISSVYVTLRNQIMSPTLLLSITIASLCPVRSTLVLLLIVVIVPSLVPEESGTRTRRTSSTRSLVTEERACRTL